VPDQPLIYFWRSSDRPSGRLDFGWQKRTAIKHKPSATSGGWTASTCRVRISLFKHWVTTNLHQSTSAFLRLWKRLWRTSSVPAYKLISRAHFIEWRFANMTVERVCFNYPQAILQWRSLAWITGHLWSDCTLTVGVYCIETVRSVCIAEYSNSRSVASCS